VRREQEIRDCMALSTTRLVGFLDPPGTDSSPSQKAERNEQLLLVAEAVERLPDDQKDAFVLKVLNGLKVEEVAQVLGCEPKKVANLLYRARCKLRELLANSRE
jgi:RNA polymerase sigma factor (sigma-70 family)